MQRAIPEPGDYLAVDDINGFTYPASEMVMLPNGAFVHRSRAELTQVDHPQNFVRAVPDGVPPAIIRPRAPTSAYVP